MKTRIKVAVVLNGRETYLLANVLERFVRGVKVVASNPEEAAEEKQVIEEFLEKRTALQKWVR